MKLPASSELVENVLLDLPRELLLEIWHALETTRDMNALAQTCHYSYHNFNPRLYHWITGHWARYHAFFNWIAEHGPVEALHHLLDAVSNFRLGA